MTLLDIDPAGTRFDLTPFDRLITASSDRDGVDPSIDTRAPLDQVEEPDDGDDDEPVGSSYARCADGNGTLTHLFFSDDKYGIARAKAICSKCGLAPTCLADALDRAEPFGVWGGQLLVDGVIVAIKRGRGRPPKNPRPPLVVDEVPVPPHLVA